MMETCGSSWDGKVATSTGEESLRGVILGDAHGD